MDFYTIKERSAKNGVLEIYPDFKVMRSKDLMVRGKSFYAIWDEESGVWSTDEYDVQRLVDNDLKRYSVEAKKKHDGIVRTLYLADFSNNTWMHFKNYVKNLSDSSTQLDEVLTFSNTEVKKTDYVSRRLPYPLEEGSISAYDELIGTLYSEEERKKLEWAIGSIISGDSKVIQKFIVLYGAAGAGKSTVLNIIQKLFDGYFTTFEAKALTGSSNSFSTEVFRSNPLVAIQHDGDLSRIEDNTKLNSIVSHEDMTMNEKYKPSYMSRINAFLFMGTNKPVKITDAKSGIIRRLIDVKPSGDKVSPTRYHTLVSQIDFELGAIAHHCLGVYRGMGMDYYSSYRPVEMMLQTDVFFNYIEEHFDLFKRQDGVSLTQAYELYKVYCEDTNVDWKLPKFKFREELRNYFSGFEDRAVVDGERIRSWYSGFITEHISIQGKEEKPMSLVLNHTDSVIDEVLGNQPAQYANEHETPSYKWENVTTKLSDLDSSKIHYVKPPLNHIVIDFDLTNDDGEKDAERNLIAASKWPATYAEYSKGGSGIHLHYIYEGDVNELSRIYSEGIEIKVFNGNSSLRRRLSRCNNIPVAIINSGLPLKEKKMTTDSDTVMSEKGLRDLILRNLRKEIHPATKPSIDFIKKILDDAFESDLVYDVSDMRGDILAFANNSTNQALGAMMQVQKMKFESENREDTGIVSNPEDGRLVFFDVEVFKNLFVVCWKFEDSSSVAKMINPSAQAIEDLLKLRLVGFNVRHYDNHILYARSLGYDNMELYNLSKKIIGNSPNAKFGAAYNLSYVDIHDYASKKQSLAKWQIEIGVNHLELGLDWDVPVPEDKFMIVADYCANDVITTEALHKARIADYNARLILSDLSGLAPNNTTQQHTAQIVLEGDRNASKKFVYTDLSEDFEGYVYDFGKSTYREEEVGEGGYVYAEPGMYDNVLELDVTSMHPTSIVNLNLFGPYTKNFKDLIDARVAIKNKEYDKARKMLGGVLKPYLKDEDSAKELSYALKIALNIVYGLTAAKFDNPFKDSRNKDNIVAKRGALFMVDLKNLVQEEGYQVLHIKTDSIKIPNADDYIIDKIQEFGKKWGYDFEFDEKEDLYDRFCLVNDAVFIAKIANTDRNKGWVAVGAQFKHPYVFKTFFSGEPITIDDYSEVKSVTTALYLDFNDKDTPMINEDTKDMRYIGKTGSFIPVTKDGGYLVREKGDNYHSATGASGHKWQETRIVKELGRTDTIDMSYYHRLADAAVTTISAFGDFEKFVR